MLTKTTTTNAPKYTDDDELRDDWGASIKKAQRRLQAQARCRHG